MLLSLLVMALWGSLFPCVKIGYAAFLLISLGILAGHHTGRERVQSH